MANEISPFEELRDSNKRSIGIFLKKIDLDDALEFAKLARAKTNTNYQSFKYFCGICHNVIRKRSENV